MSQNIQWTLEGHTLVIKVDLSKRIGPSSTGKTIIIASTQGNEKVGGTGASFGLNVFTKEGV